MAKGPERLVRWIMGHTQPVPYSLDIEHPAMDDIAWAADEIERLQAELRAASRNPTLDAMSDLPYPEDRGATHYDGCWSERGHHNCAVQHIYALNQRIRALLDENEQLRAADRGRTRLSCCVVDGYKSR